MTGRRHREARRLPPDAGLGEPPLGRRARLDRRHRELQLALGDAVLDGARHPRIGDPRLVGQLAVHVGQPDPLGHLDLRPSRDLPLALHL